jgi:hypothetical protein
MDILAMDYIDYKRTVSNDIRGVQRAGNRGALGRSSSTSSRRSWSSATCT